MCSPQQAKFQAAFLGGRAGAVQVCLPGISPGISPGMNSKERA